MNNALDEVITASEAAKMTGLTVQHIRRICKAGKLTARYADGVYLILRQSAESYRVNSRKGEPYE